MPRPKVDPKDRQRSVIACVPCKKAKIRCDAKTPCATCSKRGRESSCIYQEPSGRVNRGRRRSLLDSPENEILPKSTGTSTEGHVVTVSAESNVGVDLTSDETKGPQSRMLLSSKLQKVYIGENASLSYLQFVRRVLKTHIGPCAFTEGDFNNFMLESHVAGLGGNDTPSTLDIGEKQTLVQYYLDSTSGILDLYTKAEIFSSLEEASPTIGSAALHIILAIGAQCRGIIPSDLQCTTSFFTQGQLLSFEGMLCDPTFEMVKNFLLMAFYMLGACHRNAAFMYLGVAAQAASALGLHRPEQYRGLSSDECNTRLNTWKSLRVLDSTVNSILGRSGTLSSTQYDARLNDIIVPDKVDSVREMALQSIFDICPFLEELESKNCNLDVVSTEAFLQRLQKWSHSLPKVLRTSNDADLTVSTAVDRERFIGGTHVACEYYFAVILATRRFLTLHLLNQLQERMSSDASVSKSSKEDKTSDLAYVCLNAAINLAGVGHNAMKSNQMLNNMCMLKAWMFAAGLLLGFSVFAQGSNTENEAEKAFHQARNVLKKLAELSLQAGHYFEILSSLGDAVSWSQRRASEKRRQTTSQYMDQIFTANNLNDVDGPTGASTSLAPSPDPGINGMSGVGSQPNMDFTNLPGQSTMYGNYGMTISEGFPWPADDLSLDWQAFAPFFEDIT